MIAPSEREPLRRIAKAARTVGESLDWVDHGGGDRAWKLIGEQPALLDQALAELSDETRSQIPQELIDRFHRWPQHAWSDLEDVAKALLGEGESARR